MKKKIVCVLTMCVLLIFLTACGKNNNNDRTEAVIESVDETKDNVNESNNKASGDLAETGLLPDNTNSVSANITEEEAKRIALEHAGFTEDQVSRLQVEYDIDEGVPEYEVQYYRDNMEYDYSINAETGAIVSFDWDND